MSQAPIFNAKDRDLSAVAGDVPDVSGALFSYFQEMTFTIVSKTVVNFQVVETATNIVFQGVWMPARTQDLMIKPEGQRKWKYFKVFSQINVELDPDDIITYRGTQYRVVAKRDENLYGYFEMDLCEDYTGEP